MKLVRYGSMGHEKPGLIGEDGFLYDLSDIVDDIAGDTLLPEKLAELSLLKTKALPIVEGVAQKDIRLGPCVGKTGKFICIGLNYADHAAEAGMDIPPEPVIFNKWTSAIIGPDDDVQIPKASVKTDWEVELGVIIGKSGSYIDEADALSHVAGYCVINDISEREFQIERAGSWDKGKGCDTFGPIGPWLVTLDEIDNVNDLAMWCEIDGVKYQNGSTSTMVYKVPFLISYCSRFMSLQTGDIISTGTPPGVGMGQNPPIYLKGGEVMRLGIDNLGIQTQMVKGASR